MKQLFIGIMIVASLVAGGVVLLERPAEAASTSNCTRTIVRYGSRGTCAKYAQQLLLKRGHTLGRYGADGVFGNISVNATLNFQRSQKLYDDGVIGSNTWARLLKPRAVSTAIPASCKVKGKVLCASQAERKLRFMKDGQVAKTFNVRFGGWAREVDGSMRISRTSKGSSFKVTQKVESGYRSGTYFNASMPLAMRYNGGEFVHYSPDFNSTGYTGASHGCINVGRKSDALWLFQHTPSGTRVVVY